MTPLGFAESLNRTLKFASEGCHMTRTMAHLEKMRSIPPRSLSRLMLEIDTRRRPAVEERLANTPKTMKRGYLRAASGKAAPKAAIKAFCYECMGYSRVDIPGCTAVACPLWKYRPGG